MADAWPLIPPHIRDAIQTLVDAALVPSHGTHSSMRCTLEPPPLLPDEAAWQMAQQCRRIIQACLREEEWQDADHEFFGVIREGLAASGRHSL